MAAKTQRWPISRPARGSVGICGSFLETRGPRNRTDLSGPGRYGLLILRKLSGTEREKTGQTCPVRPSSPVRGLPPDFIVRPGWMELGGGGRGVGTVSVWGGVG